MWVSHGIFISPIQMTHYFQAETIVMWFPLTQPPEAPYEQRPKLIGKHKQKAWWHCGIDRMKVLDPVAFLPLQDTDGRFSTFTFLTRH